MIAIGIWYERHTNCIKSTTVGVTNLLCFLVCAVHFGKEIGRQLVLKYILFFSITMKGVS